MGNFIDKYIVLKKLKKINQDITKLPAGSEEIQGYCSYELEIGKSITLYSNAFKDLRSYHCTSPIVSIDFKKQIIQTKNSLFHYEIK